MSQKTLQILTCFNILDCDQCCHLHAISNAYGKIWACRGTAIGQLSKLRLAEMYETGKGQLAKNHVLSYMWYDLYIKYFQEAALSVPGSDIDKIITTHTQSQERIIQFMTSSQVAEAQKLSSEWMEKHQ